MNAKTIMIAVILAGAYLLAKRKTGSGTPAPATQAAAYFNPNGTIYAPGTQGQDLYFNGADWLQVDTTSGATVNLGHGA